MFVVIMSKKKATAISLPLSRTQKIMTSAVGVESVNQDIVALATKATEIFLMDFARRAYDQSSDEEFRSNILEYDDIQKLVHSDSRYDFLIDTTPKRIKFSEALHLVEEANKRKEAPSKLDKEDNKEKVDSSEPEKKEKEEQEQERESIHEDQEEEPGAEEEEDDGPESQDDENESQREELSTF